MGIVDFTLAGSLTSLRRFTLAAVDPFCRDDVARFDVSGLTAGARLHYKVVSDAGAGSVTGSELADGSGEAALEIDVSTLPVGLLSIVVRSPMRRNSKATVGKIEPGGMLDDYLARASWEPAWHIVQLLQDYIDAGEANGFLAKLDVIAFAAVADAAAVVNFPNDDWTFTVTNSPAHEPYRGYRGNSATGTKIATDYPLDGSEQYQLNDCHIAVYTLEGVAEATHYVAGSAFGSDTGRLGVRPWTGTALSVQINSILNANFSVSGPLGLSAADRIPADVGNVHLGRDTVTAIRAQPATGYPPGNLNVLIRGAGSDTATDGLAAYFSAGAGLTDSERAAESAAVSQYLLGIGAITSIDAPEPLPAGPNYMTRAMNAALTFEVWHFGNGPESDTQTEVNFNQFPLTHAVSGSPSMADSTWTGNKVYYVWDDRADGGANTRPNPLGLGRLFKDSAGREARTRFSTIARAMASTRARIAWSLGYSIGWIETNILIPVGLAEEDVLYVQDMVDGGLSWIDDNFDTITDAQGAVFINETFVNYACTVDKVLLSDWKLATITHGVAWGSLLDAEAHDNRTEAEMKALGTAIRALHDNAPGGPRLFASFFNPLNKTLRLANGISPYSLPSWHADCDRTFLTIGVLNPEGTGNVAAQVANQVDLIRGPDGTSPIDYSKLGLLFQFGVYATATSEADALAAYTAITSLGMAGMFCWPYAAKFGGDSTRLTVRKQHLGFFGVAAGDPIIIPGNLIVARFDAERTDLLTKDTGVTEAVETFTDAVDGVALPQATVGNRPIWSATVYGGRPGISFTASLQHHLRLAGVPTTFRTGAAPGEIWVAMYGPTATVAAGAQTFFGWGGPGGFQQRQIQQSSLGAVGGDAIARASVGKGSTPVAVAESTATTYGYHVIRMVVTATTVMVEIDGTQSATTAVVPATGTSFVTIGATSSTTAANFFEGIINLVEVTQILTTEQADAKRLEFQQRLP